MKLILFRHGIAIDRDHPDCPDDPDRFLTEAGIEKTRLAAAGLATLVERVDAVITSPYVRARQTAEIAAKALRHVSPIEFDDALMWMMPPKKIVKRLVVRSEKTILLAGHAPHLDELVAYLCGAKSAFTSMKKAAAVEIGCLELERGGGYLIAHYPPRCLRALAVAS